MPSPIDGTVRPVYLKTGNPVQVGLTTVNVTLQTLNTDGTSTPSGSAVTCTETDPGTYRGYVSSSFNGEAAFRLTSGGSIYRRTPISPTTKTGYILDPAGLDQVQIEPSINARQALSPILAAAAGKAAGMTTGTVTISSGTAPGETDVPRIIASTDGIGNRTSVTLDLPT